MRETGLPIILSFILSSCPHLTIPGVWRIRPLSKSYSLLPDGKVNWWVLLFVDEEATACFISLLFFSFALATDPRVFAFVSWSWWSLRLSRSRTIDSPFFILKDHLSRNFSCVGTSSAQKIARECGFMEVSLRTSARNEISFFFIELSTRFLASESLMYRSGQDLSY